VKEIVSDEGRELQWKVRWCIKLWDITSLGSVQVVGFFDVATRLFSGDGPIAELVGTARSFLCCDERIPVTFPSSILSDYVHMKARCVFMVSVLYVRNCLSVITESSFHRQGAAYST